MNNQDKIQALLEDGDAAVREAARQMLRLCVQVPQAELTKILERADNQDEY